MGIEFELKYRSTAAQQQQLLSRFGKNRQTISMETTYYDTPDRFLAGRRMTLRRRMENGISVCTLKTPCTDGGRCEWETECDDIAAAIPALCELGAPEELKDLAAGGLEAVCGARFTRHAALIELENCTLELALDRGFLKGGFRMNLMMEVEVELKSGSDEAAIAFARELAQKYNLVQERNSKYLRALSLTGRI